MTPMALRHEHRPLARLRLGRPEDVAATSPPDEGLGDRSRPASRSSPTDPEGRPPRTNAGRATAPSQSMGWYSSGTWEAMAATSSGVRSKRRVPSTGGRFTLRHGFRADPVVAHGVAEHGSHDLVIALDRPGGVCRPPGIDQPLDVPGPDLLNVERADRRQHVETEGELLPGRGGLPLGRIGGGPLLGQLGHLEAAGPRIDPHAPADVGLDGGEEGPGVALGLEAHRCDVAAAVVPVAGLVEPAPLAHAPERASRRHSATPPAMNDRYPARRFSVRPSRDARSASLGDTTATRWSSTQCSTACASKRTKRPTLTMGIRRSATKRRT